MEFYLDIIGFKVWGGKVGVGFFVIRVFLIFKCFRVVWGVGNVWG